MYLFEEQPREAQARVAVEQLLPVIWQNYQAKADERAVTIEWQTTPVTIETEEALFVAILENILQNAVKYTPQNHRVFVRLTNQAVTVISENAKISEQLIDHIHEPFIRDTTEEEAGTGLGLYLVDNLVDLLQMTWAIKNTSAGVEVTVNWRNEHVNN